MQSDIAQHYASTHPGQVQVLGVDLWNGTPAQVNSFRTSTGATYPLLMQGASPTGGDVQSLYGTYDNYVVLNKQGIVRYHAALGWPHGNRYHLNEIRACVDSLVMSLVDVPAGSFPSARLSASPNPVRVSTAITVALPNAVSDADIGVFDAAGRRIATPWRGALAAGRHEVVWDGRSVAGGPAPVGLYFVRARLGGDVRTLRLAVMR